MVLAPRLHALDDATGRLGRDVEHAELPLDLMAEPRAPKGQVVREVQGQEALAAAGRAVDQGQGILLDDPVDQPLGIGQGQQAFGRLDLEGGLVGRRQGVFLGLDGRGGHDPPPLKRRCHAW